MSKREKFKPLFLFEQQKDQFDFLKIIAKSSDLKKLRNEHKWDYSHYDKFRESDSRMTSFDSIMFLFLNEIDITEFEIKKEFYDYYGIAPVCTLVVRKCDDAEDFIKAF